MVVPLRPKVAGSQNGFEFALFPAVEMTAQVLMFGHAPEPAGAAGFVGSRGRRPLLRVALHCPKLRFRTGRSAPARLSPGRKLRKRCELSRSLIIFFIRRSLALFSLV